MKNNLDSGKFSRNLMDGDDEKIVKSVLNFTGKTKTHLDGKKYLSLLKS